MFTAAENLEEDTPRSYKTRKQPVQHSRLAWTLWLNSYRAEKKEAQEVQRDERSESGVAGCVGDTQACAARGEQETRQKRQAQTQPGETTGGRRTGIKRCCAVYTRYALLVELDDKSAQAFACVRRVERKNISLAGLLRILIRV